MDKYIVVGMGVFGTTLALKLMEKKVEVVAVDSRMELIEEIQNDVTYAVCLDTTDEKALNSLGLGEFDVGIVCIGGENFEAVLLTSVLLKNGGVKRIVTRASNPIHIKILKAVGIDEIITPEIEVAEKLAYNLVYSSLFDIIHVDEKITVAKVNAPENFIGKTIGELNLRAKYSVNVIAIEHPETKVENAGKKEGKKEVKVKKFKELIDNNPGAETVIYENDILLVSGDTKNLQELLKNV